MRVIIMLGHALPPPIAGPSEALKLENSCFVFT